MLCSRVDDLIGEVSLKFWLLAVDNVDHDINGQGTFHGVGIICNVTPKIANLARVSETDVWVVHRMNEISNYARPQMTFFYLKLPGNFTNEVTWCLV